ncbi:MAG TPA: beta-N-acetylhexosaminidase [Gammaproteobacteria bacterium]|nr:beta-N-acetylhexosaminidase [Gammaproteobacteria bacterium]
MALGPVMLDLEGLELTAEERELLQHPQTGGVILFARNYADPRQLKVLTRSIRALRTPHPMIAVDQEGGRVQRLRSGFTMLPPLAVLGKLYNQDKARALRAAAELGWLMATEVLQHGLDISFAPVLDTDYGVSGVIGNRAFHGDPQVIALLGESYIRGMREAGMAATGKHFPGHGAVRGDSHTEKPRDPRPLTELMRTDIVPFARLIPEGLDGIMPAHVIYEWVDSKPAGYSRRWVQDILRTQLKFKGVIFSDDLCMAGAELGACHADRAELALEAGCDMVLVCNHRKAAVEVLESLEGYRNPAAQLRLVRMHGRPAIVLDAARMAAARRLAAELSSNRYLE